MQITLLILSCLIANVEKLRGITQKRRVQNNHGAVLLQPWRLGIAVVVKG